MFNYIRTFVITLIVFFSIDIVWLVFIAKNLYQKELGYIMTKKPNVIAALIFYLIFIGGLIFFVINPALEKESFKYALIVGMLFGFVTYATYDLTNLATLKDWPIKITIIDMIWGTSLGGLVSSISFLITNYIK